MKDNKYGWIYGITCSMYDSEGFIKLGYTRQYISSEKKVRSHLLSRYTTALINPRIVSLIKVYEPQKAEKILFERLKEKRYNGEIFKCNYENDILPAIKWLEETEDLNKENSLPVIKLLKETEDLNKENSHHMIKLLKEKEDLNIVNKNLVLYNDSKDRYRKCLHCDYKSSKIYNLKRHINSKHISKIFNVLENVANVDANVIIDEEILPYKCTDCYKYFKHYTGLINHKEVCKKITHPYECPNCDKIYKCRQNLYFHRKKCKNTRLVVETDKQETTSKQLIEMELDGTKNITNYINHLDNQTNIQNQQNIQNNHHENITINIFPTNLYSNYNINTDHIDIDKLKEDIKNQTIEQAVNTFLRAVLQNRDNLPVIKKNLRMNYSYIHTGNNQWEMRKDTEVYSLISFHISECIQLCLEGKNLDNMKQYLKEASEALKLLTLDKKDEINKKCKQKAKRIMGVIVITAYTKNTI